MPRAPFGGGLHPIFWLKMPSSRFYCCRLSKFVQHWAGISFDGNFNHFPTFDLLSICPSLFVMSYFHLPQEAAVHERCGPCSCISAGVDFRVAPYSEPMACTGAAGVGAGVGVGGGSWCWCWEYLRRVRAPGQEHPGYSTGSCPTISHFPLFPAIMPRVAQLAVLPLRVLCHVFSP